MLNDYFEGRHISEYIAVYFVLIVQLITCDVLMTKYSYTFLLPGVLLTLLIFG